MTRASLRPRSVISMIMRVIGLALTIRAALCGLTDFHWSLVVTLAAGVIVYEWGQELSQKEEERW